MSSDLVSGIASAHNVTGAQVCLRWVLQKGAIIAAGTGSNSSTAKAYAEEDLDLFGFELTDAACGFVKFTREQVLLLKRKQTTDILAIQSTIELMSHT